MDIHQNPLWLSIPCFSLFGIRIRVSIWCLLIVLLLCANLGWQNGLAASAILLASLLVHELSHVLAARKTGGGGHEILIWPLGGLAFASPAPNFFSETWTILAGPLSNGLICLATLPYVYSFPEFKQAASLLYLPAVNLQFELLPGLMLLVFSINLKLTLVNLLLPIFPLDCGQFLYTCCKLHWDRQTAKVGSLWVSMLGALLLMIVGWYGGWYWRSFDMLLLGSVLLGFCQYEFVVAQVARAYDDSFSFMGYDFSQGYTSLDGGDDRESARQPGLFERWRRERAEKKRQRDELLKIETERRLDELLAKIYEQGKDSLTADERRFLQRASNQYRSPRHD